MCFVWRIGAAEDEKVEAWNMCEYFLRVLILLLPPPSPAVILSRQLPTERFYRSPELFITHHKSAEKVGQIGN